ncbi:inovirus Gp2 family protein [Uliginosibacterium sp. sgz301328]|uniref:inovirus Gp2 family protein n=1 Tax=Uliginosibacterium sp. sgz301328 TaxID=3243764 RepID=UPI00359D984A
MYVRNPYNTNLILWYEPLYKGMQVQVQKGPLIAQYLGRLHQTMQRAVAAHPRTLAFRVDLRFPEWMTVDEDTSNFILQRFVDSFKAKVEHNRMSAQRRLERAHDTDVRFAWAREHGIHGKPHFHFAFFLNHDAFHTLGLFELGHRNLFNFLHEAWASALRLPEDGVVGLLHFPEGGAHRLNARNPQSFADFFYVASYLCKAATKEYGNGLHGFGTSRF